MLDQQVLENIQRNNNFVNKELLKEITELLKDKPDAVEFLYLYGEYGELLDDVVDESPEILRAQRVDEYVIKLNNCKYWQQHMQYLWVVRWLVHNSYFDSVKWEHSDVEWKRRDAKCLSHSGYLMLFAVILIEFGIDKLNEISLRFREHAHLKHINDPI